MLPRLYRPSHGRLIIRDAETRHALRLQRRERRSVVVAWVAMILLGVIFWAVVIGAVVK